METEQSSSQVHDGQLYKIRHSLAHLLAKAVQDYRPGTKLGFGPPIKDGFYYDFILSAPLSEEDFPVLERNVRKLIKKNKVFSRQDLSVEDAFAKIIEMDEPHKLEYAKELVEKKGIKELSFYKNGDFVDMCEGPHIDFPKEIDPRCFKLRSVAGAYWRGDNRNVMMTRIYAWAFETESKLLDHVEKWELLQQRDHKKLGQQLDIFSFDNEIGRGLPLWLPNGTILKDELEKIGWSA